MCVLLAVLQPFITPRLFNIKKQARLFIIKRCVCATEL
jgi:hypothetical protein